MEDGFLNRAFVLWRFQPGSEVVLMTCVGVVHVACAPQVTNKRFRELSKTPNQRLDEAHLRQCLFSYKKGALKQIPRLLGALEIVVVAVQGSPRGAVVSVQLSQC